MKRDISEIVLAYKLVEMAKRLIQKWERKPTRRHKEERNVKS